MHLKPLITLLFILIASLISPPQLVNAEEKESLKKTEIIEQLPKDFSPAFTRDTVIKLNAIVRQSFDIYNEYDAIIDEARHTITAASKSDASNETKHQAQQKLTLLGALKIRSQQALGKMTKAATELRQNGETYNKAILAGMIDFVEDIERVMSNEYASLKQMLDKT